MITSILSKKYTSIFYSSGDFDLISKIAQQNTHITTQLIQNMIFYKVYLLTFYITVLDYNWMRLLVDAKHIRGGSVGKDTESLLSLESNSNSTMNLTASPPDISSQNVTGSSNRMILSGFYTWGTIRSYMNHKSIDAVWKTKGTNIHMWTSYAFNSWNQNQIFTTNLESIELFPGNNLCLDTYPSNPGQRVFLWTCNGGGSQKWYSDRQNRIHLKSRPELCLDIANRNPNDGASLVLWYCHNGDNQKWYQTLMTGEGMDPIKIV